MLMEIQEVTPDDVLLPWRGQAVLLLVDKGKRMIRSHELYKEACQRCAVVHGYAKRLMQRMGFWRRIKQLWLVGEGSE